MKKILTAHCLVKNEERWIWFAINSVIEYVDRIIVFDTGSTDNTVKIVKSIRSPKIHFSQKGNVDRIHFTKFRQQMIDMTTTEWFQILDGDEVWTEGAMKEIVHTVQTAKKTTHAFYASQWICEGDIFHFNSNVERLTNEVYEKKGFWVPRVIRRIPGIKAYGEYGYESFHDHDGINVSYWDPKRIVFLKHKYFHMTALPRSENSTKDRAVMMRRHKTHFYTGTAFPRDFKYPESFSYAFPDFVSDPWHRFNTKDRIIGFFYRLENKLLYFLNKKGFV